MILRGAIIALSLPCAALAQGITLSSPIDCDLVSDCYIQQYVDHDLGPGATDFHCSTLSYDGHKGTDFALPDRNAVERGIKVLASADGTVKGVRDNMPDQIGSDIDAAAVDGKECGNGLVIDHGEGWETQYCHMRRSSLLVSPGQRVARGDILGDVGQSGLAGFAHVHLSVRKDGQVIDPFDPDGTLTCANPGDSSLWDTSPPYRPGGILSVGLSDRVPDYEAVKQGSAGREALSTAAPALVVFALMFGTQEGDLLSLSLTGPDGIVIEDNIDLTRPQAQSFRAIGRKTRQSGWPIGIYTGQATLRRGNAVVSESTTEMNMH
jgi:hypothetical protein